MQNCRQGKVMYYTYLHPYSTYIVCRYRVASTAKISRRVSAKRSQPPSDDHYYQLPSLSYCVAVELPQRSLVDHSIHVFSHRKCCRFCTCNAATSSSPSREVFFAFLLCVKSISILGESVPWRNKCRSSDSF